MSLGDSLWRKIDKGTPLQYTPGYSIYIYGKGDVRVDVPSHWHLNQTENTTELRDQPEPDTCGMIQITVFPPLHELLLPGPPLHELFEDMQKGSQVEVLSWGKIRESKDRDMQMLWQERRYVDDDTGRIARGTTHLARGGGRHVVITTTCWDEEKEKFAPIFAVVRRSVRISEFGDALTGHRQRARDN
jgi:hypothetical protein